MKKRVLFLCVVLLGLCGCGQSVITMSEEEEELIADFEEDNPGGADSLTWKRVTDITPYWELFEGKIEFNDVQQGSLGNCYFLSSITALTEYPFLIREKFRTRKFNEEGYYEIVFFIDGEWQIVMIQGKKNLHLLLHIIMNYGQCF